MSALDTGHVRTASFGTRFGTVLFALLVALPTVALAAPGAYSLDDLDTDLPKCVEIAEQEEAALLFANHCDQTFTVTPIAEACLGCDPAIVIEPGEIGWYGLAPTPNGDGTAAMGTRAATWHQDSGRSGTISARVGMAPVELAGGGCAIHPAAPAGGAFVGFAFIFGSLVRLRRRRS